MMTTEKFIVAIKEVGDLYDSDVLCERLETYSRNLYNIDYLDIQQCIYEEEKKIDLDLLRSQLEHCDYCIFAFTNETSFTGINEELYNYAYVKGVASHFLVSDSLYKRFRSSQYLKRERNAGNPACKVIKYKNDGGQTDFYTQLLNLVGVICPPQYLKRDISNMTIINTAPSIFNINSTFNNVDQAIYASQFIPDHSKKELSSLIGELKNSLLDPALNDMHEETENVTNHVELIGKEITKIKPNKLTLKCTSDGLISAAKAVTEVAPSVLSVAMKIAALISGLPIA